MEELEKLVNEVMSLLTAFGYKDVKVDYDLEKIVSINFHINGYDEFPIRYKDAIRMLVKGYLKEFYYAPGGIQMILLYKENKGLNPDDDRYSCLLNRIKYVTSKSPLYHNKEFFVNKGYTFDRYIDFEKQTDNIDDE